MTLSSLRASVLDALAAALAPSGFRKREQTLWRPRDAVRQIVHVSFIPHQGDFDFTIDVAVRHNEVEERVGRDRHLPARERNRTATVGVELGNYADGRQRRWTVAAASDVGPAIVDALSVLNRVGLPFLERFSSLEETVKVLGSGNGEALVICPLPAQRELALAAGKAVLRERAA